jgi:hypothetical protein
VLDRPKPNESLPSLSASQPSSRSQALDKQLNQFTPAINLLSLMEKGSCY